MTEFKKLAVHNYMTADQVEPTLINLYNLHPDIVTLIELPNKTWENTTSRDVHLRTGTNNSNSVGVMFKEVCMQGSGVAQIFVYPSL